MEKMRDGDWRHAAKSVHKKPQNFNRKTPPVEEEGTSVEEMAEIERMLAQLADAECAMGCDYSEGSMSSTGCHW